MCLTMARANHQLVKLSSRTIVQNQRMALLLVRKDGQVWKTKINKPICMSHLIARTVILRGIRVPQQLKMVRPLTWTTRLPTRDTTDSTPKMCRFQIITYPASLPRLKLIITTKVMATWPNLLQAMRTRIWPVDMLVDLTMWSRVTMPLKATTAARSITE